jgi:DNA-binding beta-propeller fold protein YncE
MVDTLAGTAEPGYADGDRFSARFNFASGVATDKEGNIYVADRYNARIRKIDTNGFVSTLIGSGERDDRVLEGPAAEVTLFNPDAVAVGAEGEVYFASRYNAIRRLKRDGTVEVVAGHCCDGDVDGTGRSAGFSYIPAIAVDRHGNVLIASPGSHKIRIMDIYGKVSTFAGSGSPGSADGPSTEATFVSPMGIAVLPNDDVIVADSAAKNVRLIRRGQVETLASGFTAPTGVAATADGGVLVTDFTRVKLIHRDGSVVTIAGTGDIGDADGDPATATFRPLFGIVKLRSGTIALGSAGNSIREISKAERNAEREN